MIGVDIVVRVRIGIMVGVRFIIMIGVGTVTRDRDMATVGMWEELQP